MRPDKHETETAERQSTRHVARRDNEIDEAGGASSL